MTTPTMSSWEEQRLMAKLLRGESETPPQQGAPQPSPAMMSQFFGESSGAAPAGSSAAPAGAEGGGAAVAAWPAALAAAIVANETWANKEGRRPEDFGNHMKDLASGKVLEYDAQALSDKMPGKSGKILEFGAEMGNPKGVYRHMKKSLKPWEWF